MRWRDEGHRFPHRFFVIFSCPGRRGLSDFRGF
jgi:hypothetical protein